MERYKRITEDNKEFFPWSGEMVPDRVVNKDLYNLKKKKIKSDLKFVKSIVVELKQNNKDHRKFKIEPSSDGKIIFELKSPPYGLRELKIFIKNLDIDFLNRYSITLLNKNESEWIKRYVVENDQEYISGYSIPLI